jgi:hypothetical protein
MHAAARAAGGLVNGCEKSRVLERERGGQTRDAAAHDGDAWSGFGNRLSRPRGERCSGYGDAAPAQKLAATGPAAASGLDFLDGFARSIGLRKISRQQLNETK